MKKLLIIFLLVASPIFAYTTKVYEVFAATSGSATVYTVQTGYTAHCVIVAQDGTTTDTMTVKFTISGTVGPAFTINAGEALSVGCGDTNPSYISAITVTAVSGTPTFRILALETK